MKSAPSFLGGGQRPVEPSQETGQLSHAVSLPSTDRKQETGNRKVEIECGRTRNIFRGTRARISEAKREIKAFVEHQNPV